MSDDLATTLQQLRDLLAKGVLDADAYAQTLDRLRSKYTPAAVNALLATDTLQVAPAGNTQVVSDEANVGVAISGDHYGHIFINGQISKPHTQLLAEYLQRLIDDCNELPLQYLREQRDVHDGLPISLDQVYTQLATTQDVDRERVAVADLTEAWLAEHTSMECLPAVLRTGLRVLEPPAARRDQDGAYRSRDLAGTRPKDLLRELQDGKITQVIFHGPQLVTEAIVAQPHLVLLGEPGSGKSTALRYVALTLARAGLDATVDRAAHLEGWAALGDAGHLLPIFVPILPFAKQLQNLRCLAGEKELWNYLAAQLESAGRYAGLAAAVHEAIDNGNALLMLDGLDEVAGDNSRQQVVQAVADFARTHKHCRIVVSCRVRSYVGEKNAAWQLRGWPTATLADWIPSQMVAFVGAWYRAAAAVTNMPAAKRDDRITKLRAAIRVREDLRRLGVRPLLLTIMALVHLNDPEAKLPEGRVALYSRCVDLLLKQWELARKDGSDYGSLMDYIGLPNTDTKALRPLLEQLAFDAHAARSATSPGILGRADLKEKIQDFLKQRGHSNPYEGAIRFLEYTDLRAGLLQANEVGDAYGFPHLTFQEYLAGRSLVSGLDVADRILKLRHDDRWRVPILLGVGDHVSEQKLEMPFFLLSQLIDMKDRPLAQRCYDLFLAAEITSDVGWVNLLAVKSSKDSFETLHGNLTRALAGLIEQRDLPAAERVRAGAILADLGDPRPGVCTLPPPMVKIAGGSFVIGITAEEHKREYGGDDWYKEAINTQPVTVAAFELARYPVTNAQYKLFMDNEGYNPDQPWWSAAARAWLARDDQATEGLESWQRRQYKDRPEFWDDPRFGIARPNHPVVGVSWYEATAFCAWLTEYLGDGYVYCLPSESEWEFAARGVERRMYAWGNAQPDAERANFEGIYNGTTAVGCFPAGATPGTGLLDMTGNVWEWTRSEYRACPYAPTDGREASGDVARKRFALRGASWLNRSLFLRAAYRYHNSPDNHNLNVGFRLARRPPV
ncbi:hypothetical protein OSCT_1102 [Oscillochloris trichoides DG-6]|uniref:Sulfatase-modifying factor enzyme-like domain-containing protein n=1 Tax=Oscillochloris trichoides DG-6 TaxID=765420 RepID=E1ICQ1_9CHLR|nr:SUMF1/EgtB/PvdO family nonheme iron enzyme [Oscillochloris trichoides]EFO81071.1 hypothetical protein OSCT_1102 [Oscillochloris trichoides DG-6]